MSTSTGIPQGTARLVVGILGIAAALLIYFQNPANDILSIAVMAPAGLIVIYDVINDLENPSTPVVPPQPSTPAPTSQAKTSAIARVLFLRRKTISRS
jgi:hypothetical protein